LGIPFDSTDYFEDRAFEDISIRREVIGSRQFEDCRFVRCAFPEVVFQECTFRGCLFERCDLSLVRVGGSIFTSTEFKHCKVIGVNWAEAYWPKERSLFASIDFYDSVLNYSTFIGLSLAGVHITRCVAKDVDFTEADLTGADCTGTDFSESRFMHTDLTEADFIGATNYAINASLNVLKQTKFSLPEAIALLYGLDIILSE
jgi:uncharacterized protein YjbI with pentapeptide repeats